MTIRVLESPEITDICKKKSACRKQIIDLADKFVSCGPNTFETLVRNISVAGDFFQENVTLFVVFMNPGAIIFDARKRSEEDIIKQISSLEKKKKHPTPEKVFIKMVANRLMELEKIRLGHNSYFSNLNIPSVRMDSVAGFKEQIKKLHDALIFHPIRHIEKFSEREDLTDKIFQEAWKIFEVNQVMNS